jgi:periplasmic protein TonB
MIRVTSLGVSPAALGVSVVVHAAVLLAPIGRPGTYQGIGEAAGAELSIDSIDPAPQVPEPAVPEAERAPTWPTHTHPHPVPADLVAIPHDPNLDHRFASAPMRTAAPAALADATEQDKTPRFTVAIANAPDAYGAVSPGGTARPNEADFNAAPLAEQSVDGKARLVRGISPVYPELARVEGIEGDVRLELVVGPSGAVESVHLLQGVGGGLDEAALWAVRQYRFAPATKAGRAVRVRMSWSVQFRLR